MKTCWAHQRLIERNDVAKVSFQPTMPHVLREQKELACVVAVPRSLLQLYLVPAAIGAGRSGRCRSDYVMRARLAGTMSHPAPIGQQ